MGKCKCGFSQDAENNCDGSHKVAKAVKQEIIDKIDALPIESSSTNALGMKMMAIDTIKKI